jgi:hypothetical protein
MLEATLLGGKISAECKDYSSIPLSNEGMETALERATRTESVVYLVVTTSLHGENDGTKEAMHVNEGV